MTESALWCRVEAALNEANSAEARQQAAAAEADRQGKALQQASAAPAPQASSSASTTGSVAEPASEIADHNPFTSREPVQIAFDVRLAIDGVPSGTTGTAGSTAPQTRELETSSDATVYPPRHRIAIAFAVTQQTSGNSTNTLRAQPAAVAVGPGENDFLGLYPIGTDRFDFAAVQSSHLAVEYTDGKVNATHCITLPTKEGQYQVWYVHESGQVIASSGPIIVKAGATAPLQQAPASASSSVGAAAAPPATVATPSAGPATRLTTASGSALPISASSDVADGDIALGSSASAAAVLSDLSDNTSASSKRIYRPPFLLEKHVRISTYQLYIPLPRHVRATPSHTSVAPPAPSPPSAKHSNGSAAGAHLSSSAVHSAVQAPALPFVLLPQKWKPGVAVEGDVSLSSSLPPSVEVMFELPRFGVSPASCGDGASVATGNGKDDSSGTCAYDASEGEAKLAASLTQAQLLSLPRDLYRLKLRLQHRVERSKCSMRIADDHIVIRMPLYYGGAALPDRPPSLISAEETVSLRRQGRKLACRDCGNAIMAEAATAASSAATGSANDVASTNGSADGIARSSAMTVDMAAAGGAGMKAHILPSEYWLEWSDHWLCHETQANIYIPDVDFGAMRGVVLMGETHFQMHPGDCRPGALAVRPDVPALQEVIHHEQRLQRNASGLQHGHAEADGGHTHVHDDHHHNHHDDDAADDADFQFGHDGAVPCVVECSRCCAPLGSVRFRVRQDLRARALQGSSFPIVPGCGSSYAAASSAMVLTDEWLDKLSPDADPVLRLNKDRLSVPVDADSTAPGRQAAAPSHRSNALRRYGVCSRLGNDMLSAAQARGTYSFLLVASDAGSPVPIPASSSGADDGHAGTSAMAQRYANARIAVTLVNWNSSVRGSPMHRPWNEAIDSDIFTFPSLRTPPGSVGAPSSSSPSSAAGSRGCRWDGPRELPALQVRYRALQHPFSSQDMEELDAWQGDRRVQAVPLFDEECDAVLAVLASSTGLVPPSSRVMMVQATNNIHEGGMLLGYLPFMEDV